MEPPSDGCGPFIFSPLWDPLKLGVTSLYWSGPTVGSRPQEGKASNVAAIVQVDVNKPVVRRIQRGYITPTLGGHHHGEEVT